MNLEGALTRQESAGTLSLDLSIHNWKNYPPFPAPPPNLWHLLQQCGWTRTCPCLRMLISAPVSSIIRGVRHTPLLSFLPASHAALLVFPSPSFRVQPLPTTTTATTEEWGAWSYTPVTKIASSWLFLLAHPNPSVCSQHSNWSGPVTT